jgi:hypothetical protein
MEPRNRFQGMNFASLCSLAGRYDNPIPTLFLAPMDCLKFSALVVLAFKQKKFKKGEAHQTIRRALPIVKVIAY